MGSKRGSEKAATRRHARLSLCRAAVHFEKGELEACIKDCDKAVERGRDLRLDYKLIGKALTRKGNALVKLEKLEEAVEIYHKALTEHRRDFARIR